MEYNEYQVIVVRARRDGGRLIARILTGSNPTVPARQWVFADVGEVCALIERLLQELDGSAPPVTGSATAGRRQTPEHTQD